MKKILLSLMAVMLLCGIAWAQSPTLDEHNNYVYFDSMVLVGGTADTTAPIMVGYYAHLSIWAQYDSVAASDSGHAHIIIEGSQVPDTAAAYWQSPAYDTLICSTAVASLPAVAFEDFSSSACDMRYLRLRTVATTGANDSTRVVIRMFLRE